MCDWCNAGTNCTKFWLCHLRTKSRSRKTDESKTPHRVNPDEARVHLERGMAVEDYSGSKHTHTCIIASGYSSVWSVRNMKVAYEGNLVSMLDSE